MQGERDGDGYQPQRAQLGDLGQYIANAAAVQSVDIVTTSVSAPVNTIAGQEDISLQLLEQSPLAMDGVIFDDLSRDYDQRLDLQIIGEEGVGCRGAVSLEHALEAAVDALHAGAPSGSFEPNAVPIKNVDAVPMSSSTPVLRPARRSVSAMAFQVSGLRCVMQAAGQVAKGWNGDCHASCALYRWPAAQPCDGATASIRMAVQDDA